MANRVATIHKKWEKEWEITRFNFVHSNFWDVVDLEEYISDEVTENVIMYCPTLEWCDSFSKCKNLTLACLQKYPDKPWNWDDLSKNCNVDLEWLQEFPDKPWNWRLLSQCRNFDISWIKELPDKPWRFDVIGGENMKKFRIDWIELYPDQDWDFTVISRNPNFDISWTDKYPDDNWNWWSIGQNKAFNPEWMRQYPDKTFEWETAIIGITSNPSFTYEWISYCNEVLKNIRWYWDHIVEHPNITVEDLEKYPHLISEVKDQSSISKNPNITPEFMESHPEIKWYWEWISLYNNDLSYDFILDNIDKPMLLLTTLSANSGHFSTQQLETLIQKFQTVDVDMTDCSDNYRQFIIGTKNPPHRIWGDYLYNKDLTFEYALQIKGNMVIDSNEKFPIGSFLGEKEIFMSQKQRQYMAVYRIERRWLKARYNPEYALCRKLHHKTYDNLMESKN